MDCSVIIQNNTISNIFGIGLNYNNTDQDQVMQENNIVHNLQNTAQTISIFPLVALIYSILLIFIFLVDFVLIGFYYMSFSRKRSEKAFFITIQTFFLISLASIKLSNPWIAAYIIIQGIWGGGELYFITHKQSKTQKQEVKDESNQSPSHPKISSKFHKNFILVKLILSAILFIIYLVFHIFLWQFFTSVNLGQIIIDYGFLGIILIIGLSQYVLNKRN